MFHKQLFKILSNCGIKNRYEFIDEDLINQKTFLLGFK